MSVLEAQGVRVDLAGRPVLEGVGLAISAGELVGLIGPNGAGKTTLLRAVLGLIPISAGRITVAGQTPQQMRGSIGYVPQRHEFAWDYPISVENAVLSALAHRTRWWRGFSSASHGAVADALSQVDLTMLRRCPAGQLSGGQRQRVLVARALVLQPKVLLLDEPFTGLDVPTQQLLTSLLRRLSQEGTAVLMTTHDLAAAAGLCTRMCLLNKTIIADGPPSTLDDPSVWLRAFGVERVAAVAS